MTSIYARCPICHDSYTPSGSCVIKTVTVGGRHKPREVNHTSGECRECNVAVGSVHHRCTLEPCPTCGAMLLTCGCAVEWSTVPTPRGGART